MRTIRNSLLTAPSRQTSHLFSKKNDENTFFSQTSSKTGNFFNTSFVQPKKSDNSSDLNLENEANENFQNRIKKQSIGPSVLQRKCDTCEKCEKCEQEEKNTSLNEQPDDMVMTKSMEDSTRNSGENNSNSSSDTLENTLQASKSRGKSLPVDSQMEMEQVFGTSFDKVKVHTDSKADVMNKQLQAKAFTHGEHMYFSKGSFDTSTKEGKKLLSHELTHVVQQTKDSAPKSVQRTIGDGHDLQSSRFSGNSKLEAAFDNETLIRIGANGSHVHAIQQAVVDAGHPLPKFGVDGSFGSETHASVRSYQKKKILTVDGIVGPETMGDLDQFFTDSPPNTKIPPITNICSILESDENTKTDENGLVAVSSLTEEQKELTGDTPTVNLPNGKEAIECKTPSNKKDCKDFCGCPLPASNYKGSVGDLALTMDKAVAFHENNPTPGKDPRKHICPPKGTPVRVLSIIPVGAMILLKVRFCNGPLPDKQGNMVTEVFIQQQFVHNGKKLNIKGTDEVTMLNEIELEAEGAHPGSQPDWDVAHDPSSHGQVEINGSDKKPKVKIKGKKLSSLKGDVKIKVSVCGMIALHRLTVVQPFTPNLPTPIVPSKPLGPKKTDKTPFFCEPFTNSLDEKSARSFAEIGLKKFISLFHGNDKDVLHLYMTYLNKPKVGTTGTLFPREFFSNPTSNFVKSFMKDPETIKHKDALQKLIVSRIRSNPKLVPPVGKTTLVLPFRTVLKDSELLDLNMRFKNGLTRIPGLVAGGPGKDSSDAGDDVRNVDGQFSVTNQGGGTLRILIKYTFDVFDAIDFCPGNSGGMLGLPLTMRLSRLEATPNVPTYDTPFEVLFNLKDDIIV